MIVFASPGRIANPGVLEITSVPRKFLGRGFGVVPKGTILRKGFWRLVAEFQLLRYLVALIPFPVAMLIWPELALPISQAPLLMFLLIWLVESRVLSVPRDARDKVMDEDGRARTLDLFRVRAADLLTRIAAGRGLSGGELHLVVEQSELARVAPLTIVSLQRDDGRAEVLSLTDDEVAMIEAELFSGDLTERRLQRANQSQNEFLRSVVLDTRTISAHARLEALASARA